MPAFRFAGFEKWTNKDGKTAELELVKVVDDGDGEKSGEFKMRNGKIVTLKASDLSEEADGEARGMSWQPARRRGEGQAERLRQDVSTAIWSSSTASR